MASERFETVSSPERLAAIGPAWTGLWAQGGLVFQSHAWIAAWWGSLLDRDRRSLAIVLAWRGERLVGVLPLSVMRRRGVRILEWAARDCTDYGDALVGPGESADLVRAMWRHASRTGGFDIATLTRLRPDAAARALAGSGRPGAVRLAPDHRTEENWRVVGTWPSGTAWFDAQPKKVRQNYRRGRSFLAERGPVAFRLLGSGEALAPVLDRLVTLKRRWLSANGLPPGPFYEPGSRALAAMVGALADAGLLHVFVLECGGDLVAVSVNFVQDGTMMAFVTTYDPAFERGSPGMVLMMDYIMWSLDRGLRTVDFLCGDEGFKGRFGTQARTLDALMGARTPQGAAALLVDRARQALRRRRIAAEDAAKPAPAGGAASGPLPKAAA